MAQQSKTMPFSLVRNLSELLDKQVGRVEANEEISQEVFGEPDFHSVTGIIVEYNDYDDYEEIWVTVEGKNSKGSGIAFLFKCHHEGTDLNGLTLQFLSDEGSQDEAIPFTEESFMEFYKGVSNFIKPFIDDIKEVMLISSLISQITVKVLRDGNKYSYVSEYINPISKEFGVPFTGRFRRGSRYNRISNSFAK